MTNAPALPIPSVALRGLCHGVRALAALAMLGLLALPLWFALSSDALLMLAPDVAGVRRDHTTIDTRARWLAAAVTLLPVAAGLYALLALWRLFGTYLRGAALTTAAQRLLQRFAWALLALAILRPLYGSLMSVALTLGNAPGQRQLVVSLSSDDYALILLSLVLLAIALVMHEAVRAARENQEFV